MARPLTTSKQTIDLAAPAVAGSRIRRNPPPAAKREPVIDREDREKMTVAVGVLVTTLALLALIVGLGIYAGWSPSEIKLHFRMD